MDIIITSEITDKITKDVDTTLFERYGHWLKIKSEVITNKLFIYLKIIIFPMKFPIDISIL